MAYEPIATGTVASLCLNGKPVQDIVFGPAGPYRDRHSRMQRRLNKHDEDYIRTSSLKRGDSVLNWRSWTGISIEEINEVKRAIGAAIPQGILQENITFAGIPNFSKLTPASRLVFPERELQQYKRFHRQVILAVWGENGPCRGVGEPLEKDHNRPGLMTAFVNAAKGKRGVMGFVLSRGFVKIGDTVLVYPPVQ